MADIAGRVALPINVSQKLQAVVESPRPVLEVDSPHVPRSLDDGLHVGADDETRALTAGSKGVTSVGSSRAPSRGLGGSRPGSRWGGTPPPVWGTPPPSRLKRSRSQENLITKLQYKEVLDWIGALPLPHIKGPIRPETLQDGNLLWDVALHVLRPDLPNNRDEIEQIERFLVLDVASDLEKKCKALRDLGVSYHRMGLYGSSVEMHSAQLHFASALVSGGSMELMQQAIGDLGDVFRTLGEKEIAQNMYKSSLGIPNKRRVETERGGTPGGLQPWPTTPMAINDYHRETSGMDRSKTRTAGAGRKTEKRAKAHKDIQEHRPKTLQKLEKEETALDSKQEHGQRRPAVAALENILDSENNLNEVDETSLTAARRATDVFNLIHEVCGVHVAEAWPYRHPKDIKLGNGRHSPRASRPQSSALTIKLSSSHPIAATTPQTVGTAMMGECCAMDVERAQIHTAASDAGAHRPATGVRRHPEDSDTSDDDISVYNDFLDRPGTGVLGSFESKKDAGALVLTGDEAMWIAWYLCWYTKRCDLPPPDKKMLEQSRLDTPLKTEALEEKEPQLSRPATTVTPNMDFEARFGHLRRPQVVPSRGVLTKGRANWHHRALAFVGLRGENSVQSLNLAGHSMSGRRTSKNGFPNPVGLRDSHSPTLPNYSHGYASHRLCFTLHERGASQRQEIHCEEYRSVSPPVARRINSASSNSRARYASPHRPQSRQLPSERWDSFSLASDNVRSPLSDQDVQHAHAQAYMHSKAAHGQNTALLCHLGQVNPKLHAFAREIGHVGAGRGILAANATPPARPFTESDLFVTGPEDDDGVPDKVLMSDAFSWQKLDAVTVSSMSQCGTHGIVALVAGSRVGIFATAPFKRVAEIHRKDASFTCAQGCIELSFVRDVFRINTMPASALRVDVPEDKTLPSEALNFIVAGESSGHVLIANARSGVTRHTLVHDSEGLGAVIMLKLLGRASATLLYSAHSLGTLTLWSIEGQPGIIWRSHACGTGASLSGAQVVRSCVVTRDEDERCLRVWKLATHHPPPPHNNGMLAHTVLHQHTKITCFTGYQEPRNTSKSAPMIVSGGRDGTLQVWGVEEGPMDSESRVLLFGHTKAILSVFAFSRARVVSGAADTSVRVWSPKAAKCTLTLRGHTTAVTNVWCDDQQILSAETDGHLRVWSNSGSCICILDGERNPEPHTPQPIDMLVFQKPLIVALHDADGRVTIWSRDDELSGSDAAAGASLFDDKRRVLARASPKSSTQSPPNSIHAKSSPHTSQWPPNHGAGARTHTHPHTHMSAYEPGNTSKPKTAVTPMQLMQLPPPTFAATRSLALTTGDVFGDTRYHPDRDTPSNSLTPPLLRPRRMWWGSREDRVMQLWPTSRPWQSIAKDHKQPPPGVCSREGTPATATSHSGAVAGARRRRAKSVELPDLGRMTSPSPFSPPRIMPEALGSGGNYPIWMGSGSFIPDISPQHYPGASRRLGTAMQVSLRASQRALVEENVVELSAQLQLLHKGSGDYLVAAEQLTFLQGRR